MCLKLVQLMENYDHGIYEMLQEIPQNENGFINPIYGKSFEQYLLWLQKCDEDSKQAEIVDGWKVPQTTFWLLNNEYPVGYGKIRHLLTDKLREDGGTIGYSIRPSERGKGYGNELLRLLIKECAKFGIQTALLTIHKDNFISKKVALQNNGVIKSENETTSYIWIDC